MNVPKVENLMIEWVDYFHEGRTVRGSNLTYRVEGKARCSRVPWVATDARQESARIERLLESQNRKSKSVEGDHLQ